MIRADRDRLIERYMNGQMTQAEEEVFFINAAVNPELRQELKAHRLVETAVRKDRDRLPTGHAALRNRVAATLGSATPAPVIEPIASQSATVIERALSTVAAHPAVVAIVVGIITIGTVILQPLGNAPEHDSASTPTPAHTLAPTLQQPNSTAQQAKPHTTTPSAMPAPQSAQVRASNNAHNAPAASAAGNGKADGDGATTLERSNRPAADAHSTPAAANKQTEYSAPPPSVAKPDSINVGIFIDVKKPTKPQ